MPIHITKIQHEMYRIHFDSDAEAKEVSEYTIEKGLTFEETGNPLEYTTNMSPAYFQIEFDGLLSSIIHAPVETHHVRVEYNTTNSYIPQTTTDYFSEFMFDGEILGEEVREQNFVSFQATCLYDTLMDIFKECVSLETNEPMHIVRGWIDGVLVY